MRNCGSHIGQALMSDEVYGVYFGENWISVDKDVDYDDTLAKVHRTVEGYPGLYRDVQTYLRERIKEVLTGTSNSVVVRIFGPELPVLREKADEITEKIADVDGVIDASPDFAEELPHVTVELDLDRAQRFGVKPGDVRRQTSALLASEEVSDIFHAGKAYDVHVWSIPSSRDSISDVKRINIDTPDGGRVRLDQVADIRISPTPNHIQRTQQSRRIDVGANVEGRDLASAVDDVEERLEEVDMPAGYHAEVLGESTELNAAQDRLNTFGIGAAIAIFLLLQAAFGSLRLAAMTFLLLPMALVGGVLAVKLGDGILSLGSLVGFLTVFGIAARNGILMVSHFQHLEQQGGCAVRSRARAAGCEGAARADHDDGAGNRARARTAGGRGEHPRSRDRAPDGDRHPRGPVHCHGDEPVRPAFALPEVCKEQEGAPEERGHRAAGDLGTGQRIDVRTRPRISGAVPLPRIDPATRSG